MAKMTFAKADEPRVRYAEAAKEVQYKAMIGTKRSCVVKLLI